MSIKSACNCPSNRCECLKENDNISHMSSEYTTMSSNIETISFTESMDSTISQNDNTKEYICSKCDTIFKNKQTLNLHKKTVKCNDLNKEDNETKKICEFCDKKFASKQMKNYHQNNCVEKIKYDFLTFLMKSIVKRASYFRK